jgi:hypothetical protein
MDWFRFMVRASVAFTVVYILFWVAVAAVAVHFISKYW